MGIMDKLAQIEDSMFERNIAIIASRRHEVMVYSDSFVYEGFLCGLDSKWIQIYGHEEASKGDSDAQWRFILLGRDKVSGIGPTGRSVHDLSEETREWVSRKIKTFSDVSEKFLNSKGLSNDNSRKENR